MSNHDEQCLERMLEDALENASNWQGSPQRMFHKIRTRLQPRPWYQMLRVPALGATVLSLLLVLGIYYHLPQVPTNYAIQPPAVEELPVVGSVEKLRELLRGAIFRDSYGGVIIQRSTSSGDLGNARDEAGGYSSTNVQVAGVDEADIVKTDGTFLYQLRNREVTISRISPETEMEVVGRIALTESIQPREIYLDDSRLTIIASDSYWYYVDETKERIGYPLKTQILIYDITDQSAPVKIRDIDVDGSMISSRKLDSVLYLVSQRWAGWNDAKDEPAVHYRDSINGYSRKKIGLDEIRYFPGSVNESFLTVLALDTADGSKEVSVDVYLGSGHSIYMSEENLYIALQRWSNSYVGGKTHTLIHRFGVDGTELNYLGMGEVPGDLLNQFSMDEHNGYFRIATTTRVGGLSNNVYILDRSMNITGTLEGLAPGEQIYSARFMGDKGYLVTFELIDPLFVIDLSNPANPKVLGELKIPGFSNYLHPMDETTLLGIGMDTDVVKTDSGLVARPRGLKLAIFDVSDVARPKELHVEIIGGSGSYSEALHNHKALLYYNDVLSFPVWIAGSGNRAFQGATVYRVSKTGGFHLLGSVTHKDDTSSSAGWYDGNSILRSLIIDDVVYAVSHDHVSANRLAPGLPDLGRLELQ